MAEITISVEEYRGLLRAGVENTMLRNFIKDIADHRRWLYENEFETLRAMLGIEGKR